MKREGPGHFDEAPEREVRRIGKRRYEARLGINDHDLGKLRPELQIGIMVIHRAMMDWHLLIDRRAWERETLARCNFTEIRQFFNSRWCAEICRGCETMTPEHMLEILEEQLAAAMKKPPAGERDRRAAE